MNVNPVGQNAATTTQFDPATMTPAQLAEYNDLLDLMEETFSILVLSIASSSSNPTGWTGWDWRENDQQ